MGCIYRILCKSNQKSYIGQYKKDTPEIRLNRHFRDAEKGSQCAIHQAMRKYGKDMFEVSILCICETQELDKKEDYYITEYNSMVSDNGYNMVRGGKGRAPNFHHKEEHKQKMREFMKNRLVSDETKQKISDARKGTKNNWSDETRQRVAEASRKKATGVKHSEETKQKIGEKSKGRQATLGQKRTDDQKKKIGDASRGRKFSEETKQHLSEIHSQRHKENPIPNKNCKYIEDDIRYMRNNPDNLTIDELREKFNIHRYRLLKIQNKELYKHVEDLVPV
jgi:group I intron endonuclease